MKAAWLLCAVLELGAVYCAHAQPSIIFTTESYAPFSYRNPDGDYKGVGVDQITLIMRDLGVDYTFDIMPWARAIALAETEPWHCVFSAARTPEREARFKWVVPLYRDRNLLVRRAGSDVQAQTLDQARQFTVGTHREDYTETLLKELGFDTIDLSADIDTTLRKLLGNRIDMMPMSETVYRTLKADGTPLEEVMVLTEQVLGIACNRDMPDELIARMQAKLSAIVADGTQKAIERRYGIDQSP
jgi:polar amino acid transport system substrate-binding protein